MSSSGFGAAWFDSTNAICKRYCVGSTPTPAIAIYIVSGSFYTILLMLAIWSKYEIVAELVDAMIKDEVQVFLKNHNKISLATLIKMGCWFEPNLSH